MKCDIQWVNARILTCANADDGLTVIPNGSISVVDGRIVHVGPSDPTIVAQRTVDAQGRLLTPAFIDPHTHLVYGGDRANEFRRRLAGESYESIALAGGGIVSTVRATRAMSVDQLVESALSRLDALLSEGIGTVEVKSGYGLDTETEIRLLQAARRLPDIRPVRVKTTFLGAHAVPPEYRGRPDAYIDLVCQEMIPAVAESGLADAVDGFCEGIAFSPKQIERVFIAAHAYGLPVKLHAEQLSHLGGAELAARYRALSADHLEYLDVRGIQAMKQSQTVATLLPGAYYFTRESHLPPVADLRTAGVPIALGTDCNPGTSPLTSILLTMNMAATLFRMTVEECLLAVTINAARALGLSAEIGSLASGKAADFALWDVQRLEELVYRIGFNPLTQRVFAGQEVRP